MSSSVHVDNRGKDILVICEEPTQGLGHTTLTAKAKYSINFTQLRRRFALSLHYDRSNSFFCVNAAKLYHLKAKTQK